MSVPPAVAPPPGHPRFPLFDGLRAVAALAVLVTHTAFASGGNPGWYGAYTARLDIGVTIFFLISGFLLYRPFVAARFGGRPRPRVSTYARRRLLRIVPAYWLALTVLAIKPGLPGLFGPDAWVYYGFAQIYRPAWFLGGIGAAWSLCVEMSFYAALPLYALLAGRLGAGRRLRDQVRLDLGLLAVLGVASLAVRTWIHARYAGRPALEQSPLPFTLPGTFGWFALGMGMAVASAALEHADRPSRAVAFVTRRPWACWGLAAALFWALSTQLGLPRLLTPTSTLQSLAEHVLYGAVAFLLLLPVVFGDRAGGAPRRLLAARPLAWLGLVSYGIFLWHQPLTYALARHGALDWFPGGAFVSLTVATAALAIACATVSYYGMERPVLRFKNGRRRPAATEPPAPVPERELAGRPS